MNTTPHPMTGAELQTLREACGLTREALAEMASVEARTVKHWETRKGAGVPADVAALVGELARWVTAASRAGLQHTMEQRRRPHEVVLIRYRDPAHLHDSDRAQGLRADVHGAMVARLVLDLAAEGIIPRVVWFDPEGYAHWASEVQGLPAGHDTPGARAAWAAQAVERQAIPHPGDQPPAGHTPGH